MIPAGVCAFVVLIIGLLSAAALAGHKDGRTKQAADDGEISPHG